MADGDGRAHIDVLGIGNAIVDVLSHSDDAAIARHGVAKGGMTLIDAARADALYDEVGPGVEVSGGSCANTVAGIASLGGRAAYIGRVRDDALGHAFTRDLRETGVDYRTPPATDGPGTARCIVLVTPDAQRTMCTYLGASVELGPDEIDARLVESAALTYVEGYLWDPPQAKQAIRAALATARAAGRRTAMSLSDTFCVDRHRDEFLALLEADVDIVFANEDEARALFGVSSLDDALDGLARLCDIAAVTRSADGSVVVCGDERHRVAAEPVGRVVDTTGAGDLYAAGFLHGLARGMDLPLCARIGGIAAAEVIGHFGARPQTPLDALVDRTLAAA